MSELVKYHRVPMGTPNFFRNHEAVVKGCDGARDCAVFCVVCGSRICKNWRVSIAQLKDTIAVSTWYGVNGCGQ